MGGESSFKFAAFVTESELIEEVKRRAEFSGQVNNVAAADGDMALIIYLRGQGEEGKFGHISYIQSTSRILPVFAIRVKSQESMVDGQKSTVGSQ